MEDDKVMRGVSAAGDDPELAYIKDRYRTEFRQAFVDALGSLDDRQQALLRYYHVDSLNIDAIGTIYKVHRVTAYRWLEKARDALVHKTLGLLKERLNVEKNEFDSILRMIRSQLHLSLHRHLGNLGGGENDN
jgi:RNA polymerase sigma-70 factor (ECF subfamily)